MKQIHVVGAAIIDGDKCLIAKRGPNMSLPGKWEFPGGKVERDEDPRAALVREIKEELGLLIEVHECLGQGTAAFGERRIVLDVFAARCLEGELMLAEHAEVTWTGAEGLLDFDWAEADVPVLPMVAARLARGP